ncbi:MAG: hypothetical protein ACRDF4_02725 [Rhabdochlamydiaceae bacterium]
MLYAFLNARLNVEPEEKVSASGNIDMCMHECYHACMTTIQYTIRNVPRPVDRYLRKRAQLSGKSLNQIIVEELSEKVTDVSEPVGDSLGWFFGSGIDDATLRALEQEDKTQKELARKDLQDVS